MARHLVKAQGQLYLYILCHIALNGKDMEVVVTCFIAGLLPQHLVGKDIKPQNISKDLSCALHSNNDTQFVEIKYLTQ
jgi:hypothetical protein